MSEQLTERGLMNEQAAAAQHARNFVDRLLDWPNVVQRAEVDDEIERFVVERKLSCVGTNEVDRWRTMREAIPSLRQEI